MRPWRTQNLRSPLATASKLCPPLPAFVRLSGQVTGDGPLTIDTPNASKSLSFRNQSLEDSADLPNPDVIAQEIVEDLQAALAQFAEIASDLKK